MNIKLLSLKSGIVVILLMSFFSFNSCDTIDAPYGVPADTGTTGDTTTVRRNALIEDFTGHVCVYCPDSHREAARLKGIYGERLHVLAIHSGFFAKPQFNPDSSFNYDFRNTISTAIATDFGIINLPYPKGMVSRADDGSGSRILEWASWEGAVNKELNKPAVAGLKITAGYDSATRTITATVQTNILISQTNNLKLAVYFVEDSIVKWQKDGTTNVQNYVHRDVLRGSLNGVYGDDLGNNLNAGYSVTKNYNGILTPVDAIASHVSLYAILTDDVTKEVLQVTEKKIIP